MTRNDGLEDDMQNIERLDKVGGPDVTQVEGYDPSYRVGPAQSYAIDFAKQATPEAKRRGENIRDMLPDILKDGVTSDVAGGFPASAQGSAAPTGAKNNPSYIVNSPASRVNTAQVALTLSPTRIVYDAPERLSVIIVNRDQNNPVFIGAGSSVSEYTGFTIDPGASMTMAVSCELWGNAPLGAIVSVIEFLK